MRKLKLVLAATASVAFIGATVPAAASAAASADSAAARVQVREVSVQDRNCRETVQAFHDTGTVNMYNAASCGGSALCKDYDNDSDYSTGGACHGSDTNRTSSVANLGWTNVRQDVRFYSGPYYNRYIGCVKRSQYWNHIPNDANNTISSHKWANC
ncbi:hypothetical protein AB0I77_01205 [Streptomyces sp. NPDC050619]|uniref:hypothetical protein n=1 Tax=Streptomyces sp. NPDC050619 TaxID=3157214 RepID=UPI003420A71F